MKTWQDKYDTAKHGLIFFVCLFILGLALAYFSFIYPSSFKTFYKIMLYGKNDVQTQLFTLTMLPALFAFYFVQFRWQMHRASQVFVGMMLFISTFMMAAKFL